MNMHRQMADMMKAMGANAAGKRGGPMAGLASMFGLGGGGGMGGGMPSPEQLKQLAEKMPGGGKGMGGPGGGLPNLPPELPRRLPRPRQAGRPSRPAGLPRRRRSDG